MYARISDENQIMFVCERNPFPAGLKPKEWRLVATGVEAPDGAAPQIRYGAYHQSAAEDT